MSGPDEPTATPTREELDAAPKLLQALRAPEDDWWFDPANHQEYYRVSQVKGRIFGLDIDAIRTLAESGAIPGAVMPNQQAGWRLPWTGIVYYLWRTRQEQRNKQIGS